MIREELAIIEKIGIGVRDTSTPILFMQVKGLFGGSLLILSFDEAFSLIEKSQIYDIYNLKDTPCIVSITDEKTVKFISLFK